MRGNASVDAWIKVLFDTHASYHFRARAHTHRESIITDNFPIKQTRRVDEGVRYNVGYNARILRSELAVIIVYTGDVGITAKFLYNNGVSLNFALIILSTESQVHRAIPRYRKIYPRARRDHESKGQTFLIYSVEPRLPFIHY